MSSLEECSCDCFAITFHLLRLREALRYHQEGDAGRAVAKLTRAIALDPRRPELFKQRAEAQLTLQNFHSAIINFKKALSLQPSEELELTERCVDEFSLISFITSISTCEPRIAISLFVLRCQNAGEGLGPRIVLSEREREREFGLIEFTPLVPFFPSLSLLHKILFKCCAERLGVSLRSLSMQIHILGIQCQCQYSLWSLALPEI